ncbi:MAG TPA: thioredoxin domain-containing protein [Candidatus Dormibacteraeota bacterium]|nr:thioredoxin domain-containing protein [Candidatus Dormibacteraeota bacterium]
MQLRRFLVTLIRRSLLILLLICLGCVAQSAPPDIARKIEHQVRFFYNVPTEVKVTVGAITPSSEMAGYDSVSVKLDGGDGKQKDYAFLLSKDRNTMLRVTKFDLSKDAFADLMSKIDVKGRPTRGSKSAKVVVVNFDDFECPFCSRMHQTLFPEIFKEYGDRVTFIYKDYPLTEIHPWAIHAAIDANCLAAQNGDAYWDFADYIHGHKNEVDVEKTPSARTDAVDKMATLQGQKHSLDASKLQACVKAQNEDEVRASMKEADALGVNATPTLFINGQKIDGAVPISEVRAALDTALRDAGQPVPEHIPSAPTPASK